MAKYTFIISIILLFSLISSCKKGPEYPKEPIIKFEKIEKFEVFNELTLSRQDSIVIAISFTDGDGDLGLDADDLLQPDYKDKYNYIIDVYKKIGSSFVLIDLGGKEYGNFAPLVDKKYRGPIDGVLRRDIIIDHNLNTEIPNNTVIRFEVKIIDRAFNISNKIITPEVRVKE